MQCHEIDYRIIGDDLQIVEVELDPGETVIAEAGAMAWMDDHIAFESKMGDGSETSSGFFDAVIGAGKRLITPRSVAVRQRDLLPERRLLVRGPGDETRHLLQPETGPRLLRRRRLHHGASPGRRHGLSARRRYDRQEGVERGENFRRYGMSCSLYEGDRFRCSAGRQSQIDAFWRRRPFPGHAGGPWDGLSAEPPLLQTRRPHHLERPVGRRKRSGRRVASGRYLHNVRTVTVYPPSSSSATFLAPLKSAFPLASLGSDSTLRTLEGCMMGAMPPFLIRSITSAGSICAL